MDMSSLKPSSSSAQPPSDFMSDYSTLMTSQGNNQRRLILAEAENRTLKAEATASRKLIKQSSVAMKDLRAQLAKSEQETDDAEFKLLKALNQIEKLQAVVGHVKRTSSCSHNEGSLSRADSGCGVSDDESLTRVGSCEVEAKSSSRPRMAARSKTEGCLQTDWPRAG